MSILSALGLAGIASTFLVFMAFAIFGKLKPQDRSTFAVALLLCFAVAILGRFQP